MKKQGLCRFWNLTILHFVLLITVCGEFLCGLKVDFRGAAQAHLEFPNNRRRRDVAEITATDRHSRYYAHRSRSTFLSNVLTKLDSKYNEGLCKCLLLSQSFSSQTCECNIRYLFGILLKKITSASSPRDQIDVILAKLNKTQKIQLVSIALQNYSRLTNARKVQKRVRSRNTLRFLRRRKLRRFHPRSIFDGVPVFAA